LRNDKTIFHQPTVCNWCIHVCFRRFSITFKISEIDLFKKKYRSTYNYSSVFFPIFVLFFFVISRIIELKMLHFANLQRLYSSFYIRTGFKINEGNLKVSFLQSVYTLDMCTMRRLWPIKGFIPTF
jgi:hypothetical protein